MSGINCRGTKCRGTKSRDTGYLYNASHERLFRGALSVAKQVKRKVFKLHVHTETQVISPAASHFGVQEECYSKVQDPLHKRLVLG